MTKGWVASAATLWLLALLSLPAWAADSAVVILYHRFDDSRIPALDTSLPQLEFHLEELRKGGFTVLPLPEIVRAMRTGAPLPDKSVAITVDDASVTFYSRAWPLFRQARVPITLFIATDEIDRGGEAMNWSELRELQAAGVTFGSQGAARLRFPHIAPEIAAGDLARARARFERELGLAPDLFAWPGGEADLDSMRLLRDAGYHAAFGQHSGALWTRGEPYFLPRFAVTSVHGDPDRFRLAVRSLPLPATDITPDDPEVSSNPPAFGFTLAEDVAGIAALACFASHEGQVKVEQLGPRIEVRMAKPIPPGRARLNCTVPTLDGRWRWFGWQFSTP